MTGYNSNMLIISASPGQSLSHKTYSIHPAYNIYCNYAVPNINQNVKLILFCCYISKKCTVDFIAGLSTLPDVTEKYTEFNIATRLSSVEFIKLNISQF